jgi:hypothetical protein
MRGVEASDLHQEGLLKLYEVYTSAQYAGKPLDELDAIFKTALRNVFLDHYERDNRERRVLSDDVDLEVISEVWGYDAFAEAYLLHYQDHLSKLVSPDAAVLLDALLHPTPAIYHMFDIQRMRREALQSQGFNARVPKKLTHLLVGRVLGFSTSKTKALVRELQYTWRNECQLHNYNLNAAMC